MICAVADNGAIGVKGDLPWHIKGDLQFFKQTTSGCPVIMGKTTCLSIGRPLPHRFNIVLTHSGAPMEGVFSAGSLDDAYGLAEFTSSQKCFVIGGAQVYAQAMKDAEKLYITHVHTVIEDADAFFPEIDPEVWKEESRSDVQTDPESGLEYEFVVYGRK